MGLLVDGHALNWSDAKSILAYVRKHGIAQFLAVYHRVKDRKRDCLFWGDEVEYMLMEFDDAHKRVTLLLQGHQVLRDLEREIAVMSPGSRRNATRFLPEYGSYMIEATPGQPYHGDNSSFQFVEPNMRLRRQMIQRHLGPNAAVMSVVAFPMLGVGQHTTPPAEPLGPIAQSLYVPDAIINPHPRFGTLTRNIRERRTEKVEIVVPIYRDVHTQPRMAIPPELTHIQDWNIHMDAMGFGMGCCCLQVTFQCPNIDAARYLYDQASTIAPIMLALTAASPIYRGHLADIDVRWKIISGAVDDRTPEERGLKPLEHDRRLIRKSRYDSISTYLSNSRALKPEYNDVELEIEPEFYETLRQNGVDELLARHIAHLFIRDPLVIYNESIYVCDDINTNHFENIQSTNWQTMRFKPPPPDSNLGWRVEFRSMEVQMTDFENAAFTCFVALLTRAILGQQLNFYIPISKSEANMEIAHLRNAAHQERFFFRKHVTSMKAAETASATDDSYDLYTVDEIINGRTGWIGLVGVVRAYMDTQYFDDKTRAVLNTYLDFVSQRASGKLMNTAAWMREFVMKHPAYRHDSVVDMEITYDLMKAVKEISDGKRAVPELLGEFGLQPSVYEGEPKFGDGGCGPESSREFLLA